VPGAVAGNLFLVKQLHAGLQRVFRHELVRVVARSPKRPDVRRVADVQLLALVDRHRELEFAHAQPVAVEQPPGIGPAERLVGPVHVNAVRADVHQVVGAVLEIDDGVLPGDEALGVGQDPVAVQSASDGAAVRVEPAHGILAHQLLVIAHDFELQRHRFRFRANGLRARPVFSVTPDCALRQPGMLPNTSQSRP